MTNCVTTSSVEAIALSEASLRVFVLGKQWARLDNGRQEGVELGGGQLFIELASKLRTALAQTGARFQGH